MQYVFAVQLWLYQRLVCKTVYVPWSEARSPRRALLRTLEERTAARAIGYREDIWRQSTPTASKSVLLTLHSVKSVLLTLHSVKKCVIDTI